MPCALVWEWNSTLKSGLGAGIYLFLCVNPPWFPACFLWLHEVPAELMDGSGCVQTAARELEH